MKSVFFYLLLLLSILCFAGFAQSRDPFYPEQPIDSNNTHHFIDKTDNSETLQHQNSTLHHRIYPLQYADVTTVAQQLTNYGISLLSDHGRIAIDKDSNSISIIDTEKAHTEISDWLKIKETPQQQVHITAHIISSSQDALNELGTQWGLLNMKSTNLEGASNNTTTPHNIASAPLTAPSLAALALHQKTKNPLHYIAFNIARINSRLLELELSALEQEKQLAIIASPRLTAAHEKTASIKQGTEIPYVSRDNDTIRVEFKEAVLGMEVTPIIQRSNKIRLLLKISQNTPGIALVQGGSEHLSIDKQEIMTEVTIHDGETLMLGGIFQQKQQQHAAKIPFLSSLPLLGILFSHKRDQHSRHELVIFITPKLI